MGIVKAHEPMRIQAVGAELAVERLDECIVGRLSGPRKVKGNAVRVWLPSESTRAPMFVSLPVSIPTRRADSREVSRDSPAIVEGMSYKLASRFPSLSLTQFPHWANAGRWEVSSEMSPSDFQRLRCREGMLMME